MHPVGRPKVPAAAYWRGHMPPKTTELLGSAHGHVTAHGYPLPHHSHHANIVAFAIYIYLLIHAKL